MHYMTLDKALPCLRQGWACYFYEISSRNYIDRVILDLICYLMISERQSSIDVSISLKNVNKTVYKS